MTSWSHVSVRACLVAALFLVVFLLVPGFQRDMKSEGVFTFSKQLSPLRTAIPTTIANDTLGFEKMFVINAPWRSDRRDSMSLAASYTGMTLDWIDGINASDIPEKVYPPGNHKALPSGNLGSWRAHMNALREIIQQNLTTALILEDDADWDFRIRSQLADFAQAVQRLPELIARSESHSRTAVSPHQQLPPVELANRSSLSLLSLSARNNPKNEPYGQAWDMLWLGHCGAALPPPSPKSPDRILISNDITVPQPQHLRPTYDSPLDSISALYSPHTRVVHRLNTTLCTIAYSVTQSGARKLLYELGMRELDRGYDFALSDYCNGLTKSSVRERLPLCLTVQPPLFSHHIAERGRSDISGVGMGGRPEDGSRYVRWSLKMNLERLVSGGREMVEQWSDADEGG